MPERPVRRWLASISVLVAASVALAPAATAAPGGPVPDAEVTSAAAGCDAMTAAVHQANNPRSGAGLVSASAREVRKARRHGFTEGLGVVFRAATAPAPGLVPVYRMYHPRTGDFLWIRTEQGRDNAARIHGYRFEQVEFYASPERRACTVPVHRYLKGSLHRLAATDAPRRALAADGWRDEGVKFWAAPPARPSGDDGVDGDDRDDASEPAAAPTPAPRPPSPRRERGDRTFTIAVVPDTQYEVFGGDLFAQRNRWLVRHREALDLEFVLHTGDVVSWDTPGHEQYERASAAMRVLDDAGVPTAVAIGNHDTAAVTVGGSAVPGGDTKALVRDTTTFNRYFPPSRYSPEGVFEAGKVDNTYQLFSAGGEDWMILTLELWPRRAAVEWGRDVVAAHPRHNVIVQTHSYLRSDGSIQRRRDYGATSPAYLFDRLVSAYPNVRMVFSGHVGSASRRVDVGRHGNRIASFLGTFHAKRSNPVQLVEIDTAADTVSRRFVTPVDGRSLPRHDARVTGMGFS